MRTANRALHLFTGLSLSALACSVASAQGTPATAPAEPVGTADQTNSGGLGEIVVTAQKRSENLQNVPIAVTAVSGAAVEQRHATTLQGLQGTVPNIQIDNFSNTPNTAVFTIRGIGVIEPDPYAGNTVSIVYDGVPQYFSMGALLDIYDIDRVEVLRGPQGTLFGANTTGGVVNVVTRQPTGEFGGKAEVTFGNYHMRNIAGALDFPIVNDMLAGKVVVSHNSSHGYTTNVFDGSDMGKRNVTIYRGYLKFTPASNFDATLAGEYDRARNGAPIFINGSVPGEALYVPVGPVAGSLLPMYASPCEPAGEPCNAPDKYFSGRNSVPDRSDMDTYRATLTANWRDTGIGDITSVTGYKHFHLLEFTDQDGSPVFLADTRRDTTGWQLSQELRTSIDITDRFNVIAGGFYMKTHYEHRQDYRLQFAAPGLLQGNFQDQDNYALSGFVQSYYDVTDQLRLQAGIRYTHERTKMLASTITSLNLSGLSDYDGTGNVPISAVAPPRGAQSWDNVGWKLGLDYKVRPGMLLYGYWARGFKSGAFTGRLGVASDLGPADPESVDTFELGIKADLLDRRLRLNFAGFYTNYRDIQLATLYFQQDGANTIQGNSILNAAKAHIKGFELEGTALPIDGLTLTGSFAYLDATYANFLFYNANTVNGVSIGFQNLKGFALQNAPKWSATAGFSYELNVGPGKVTAHALYSYVSSKYLTALNDTLRSKIQPIHLVDANLEFTPNSGLFSLSVWATNLLDKRYLTSVYDAPGVEGLAAYAPPRRFGVTVKTQF